MNILIFFIYNLIEKEDDNMRKIVPFKKDIMFKTNIAEITSISLEHQLGIDGNVITGNFNISGQYKMNDNSENTDTFNYDLPFDINMGEHYDIKEAVVDIDDFYYEVLNHNILNVNIDVAVDKIIEKEIIDEPIVLEREDVNVQEDIQVEERCVEDENKILESIFDTLDDTNETYQSYRVYIVREGDTVESILDKYSVSKEDIEKYNDLKEIKLNDKIIIPTPYVSN